MWAGADLKADPEFVLKAVRVDGSALRHASRLLHNVPEIVAAAGNDGLLSDEYDSDDTTPSEMDADDAAYAATVAEAEAVDDEVDAFFAE